VFIKPVKKAIALFCGFSVRSSYFFRMFPDENDSTTLDCLEAYNTALCASAHEKYLPKTLHDLKKNFCIDVSFLTKVDKKRMKVARSIITQKFESH